MDNYIFKQEEVKNWGEDSDWEWDTAFRKTLDDLGTVPVIPPNDLVYVKDSSLKAASEFGARPELLHSNLRVGWLAGWLAGWLHACMQSGGRAAAGLGHCSRFLSCGHHQDLFVEQASG